MDKRTAWVSGVLAAIIFLGVGGTIYSMHHRQAERIDVLQRETKEKDKQITQLTDQIKDQKQNIQSLQEQLDVQKKFVEESQKKANF